MKQEQTTENVAVLLSMLYRSKSIALEALAAYRDESNIPLIEKYLLVTPTTHHFARPHPLHFITPRMFINRFGNFD